MKPAKERQLPTASRPWRTASARSARAMAHAKRGSPPKCAPGSTPSMLDREVGGGRGEEARTEAVAAAEAAGAAMVLTEEVVVEAAGAGQS